MKIFFRRSGLLLALALLFAARSATAQRDSSFRVNASAELVSSYIWRGSPSLTGNSNRPLLAPNLQPSLALGYGGFEVGAWGSTDFTGAYHEVDTYVSYAYKGLTFTFSDYFGDTSWGSNSYFCYTNETTGHLLEASLGYDFQKIPLRLTVATMLYGADKKADDESVNNYSTYMELGYKFNVKEYDLDAFLGMTPFDGFYGDGYGGVTGFGVVNLGVTGSHKLQISEKFKPVLRTSLILNPQRERIFIVMGIML
jgi:hypothetical protein